VAENFRVAAYLGLGEKPAFEREGFQEAVFAVQAAEDWLRENDGLYAQVRFNGSGEIHIVMRLRKDVIELWNTPQALWPVQIAEDDPTGVNLPDVLGELYEQEFQEAQKDKAPKDDTDENSKRDDDSQVTDLSDGSDHEEVEDDDEEDEDFNDDDPEGGEWEDEEEEDDEQDDEGEDEDGEGESNDGDEDGDSDTDPEEMERPVLYGKFRGPKGWRKRAETDPEADKNRFSFKVGVLDEDAETTKHQETDVRVNVNYTESDEDREGGMLEIVVPNGTEFQPIHQSGNNETMIFLARIPHDA